MVHMNLDYESTLMQTLSTHKGVKSNKVKRLKFGVKTAPGAWQRSIIIRSKRNRLFLRRHRHSKNDQIRTIH